MSNRRQELWRQRDQLIQNATSRFTFLGPDPIMIKERQGIDAEINRLFILKRQALAIQGLSIL